MNQGTRIRTRTCRRLGRLDGGARTQDRLRLMVIIRMMIDDDDDDRRHSSGMTPSSPSRGLMPRASRGVLVRG